MCVECREGYFLNRKNHCENLIFPKCDFIGNKGCNTC